MIRSFKHTALILTLALGAQSMPAQADLVDNVRMAGVAFLGSSVSFLLGAGIAIAACDSHSSEPMAIPFAMTALVGPIIAGACNKYICKPSDSKEASTKAALTCATLNTLIATTTALGISYFMKIHDKHVLAAGVILASALAHIPGVALASLFDKKYEPAAQPSPGEPYYSGKPHYVGDPTWEKNEQNK